MKFGFDRASGFREEFEDIEIVDANGRQTPEHGYTISSPCETDGSGELKETVIFFFLLLKA